MGKVSFIEAVVLFFKNYVNFRGRSTRSEFWWAFLFYLIVGTVVGMIDTGLSSIVTLLFFLPQLSLSIRRLHDTGKSWLYYLLGFIPIAGMIILIVFWCQPSDGDNQWGPNPFA